jgi:putative NADH-flavin reductase
MSKIGIVGASGQLGGHLITYALAAGYSVHALTRDPRRIRKANEDLTVYKGDAEKGEGLVSFVTGCRYVVYAANAGQPAEAVAHLVRAIGLKRMDRLVLVSRVGTGDSELQGRKVSGMLASFLPRMRKGLYAHMNEAEDLLRISGLPYSIFRATELTDEGGGHEVAVARANDAPPSRVGRADLARFIIHSLEEPSWNLQEVTVGSKRH